MTPETQIKLTDKESRIMNSITAGLTIAEIAGQIHYSPSTIKNNLSGFYKRLGVGGGLGAALVLVEAGLIDTQALRQMVDLEKFSSLSRRQCDVLEVLISGNTQTDQSIANSLHIARSTVKNSLSIISKRVGVSAGVNRIALGAGYWLYKKGITETEDGSRKADVKQVTERQKEIICLEALGLSSIGVADRLGLSASTVKRNLSKACKTLGVTSLLEAVLRLIKEEKINPLQLSQDFDLFLFHELTSNQLALIQALIEGSGSFGRNNEALKAHLNCSLMTVTNRITEIGELLGISGSARLRVKIAVLFLAYQQQKMETLL